MTGTFCEACGGNLKRDAAIAQLATRLVTRDRQYALQQADVHALRYRLGGDLSDLWLSEAIYEAAGIHAAVMILQQRDDARRAA